MYTAVCVSLFHYNRMLFTITEVLSYATMQVHIFTEEVISTNITRSVTLMCVHNSFMLSRNNYIAEVYAYLQVGCS